MTLLWVFWLIDVLLLRGLERGHEGDVFLVWWQVPSAVAPMLHPWEEGPSQEGAFFEQFQAQSSAEQRLENIRQGSLRDLEPTGNRTFAVWAAIPGELSKPVIITISYLAFRKPACHNSPLIRLSDPFHIGGCDGNSCSRCA